MTTEGWRELLRGCNINKNLLPDAKGFCHVKPVSLHGMSLYLWASQGTQFYNASAINHLAHKRKIYASLDRLDYSAFKM